MKRIVRAFAWACALGSVAGAGRAADLTWISESDGDWTDAAHWNALVYPGQVASDNAFLTNAVPGLYRVTLDRNPANPVPAIVISNAVGEAWLQITNCAYTVTSELRLRQGARLRLDKAAVSGIAGGSFNMLGTDPALYLNEGAYLQTAGNVNMFPSGSSGQTGLVSSLTGEFGIWNLSNNAWFIAPAGLQNLLRIERAQVENFDRVFVGSSGGISNTLVIANGARLIFGKGSSVRSAEGDGASWNGMLITGEGTFFDLRGGYHYIGGSTGNNQTGNWFRVEHGAVVTNSTLEWAVTSVGRSNLDKNENRYEIDSGGRVYARAFAVGPLNTHHGNILSVTGAGSLLYHLSDGITVGNGTSVGNTLRIGDGGRIENAGTITIRENSILDFTEGLLAANAMDYREAQYTLGADCVFRGRGGTWDFQNGLVLADGSILEGAGTFHGNGDGVEAEAGARLRPGADAPGELTVNNLTWQSGAIYVCRMADLASAPGAGWSLLNAPELEVDATALAPVVIALDSMGAAVANFEADGRYMLRIMDVPDWAEDDFDADLFELDDAALQLPEEPTASWTLAHIDYGLYLVYGDAETYDPADAVWKVAQSGNWSVDANWEEETAPGSDPARVLEFGGGAAPYFSTNNNAGTFQVNKLLLTGNTAFTNAISGNALEINGADGGLYKTGLGSALSASSSYAISNAIVLADTARFAGPALGGTVMLAGSVGGTGALIKEGLWNLALGADNDFVGNVVMNSPDAWLRVDTALGLGANDLYISNGWVRVSVPFVFAGDAAMRKAIATGSGSFWDMGANSLTLGPKAEAVVTNAARLVCGALTLAGDGDTLTQLLVADGSRLTSSAASFIGNDTSGSFLRLTGAGSRWDMGTQHLSVGSGAGVMNNALTLDAGTVLAGINVLYCGNGAAAQNNVFTNAGSLTASLIRVGVGGGIGNGMLVCDAGAVTITGTTVPPLQIGEGAGARDNWVHVTGVGTTLKYSAGNARAFHVGEANTSNNWLRVDNGAFMDFGYTCHIGRANARGNSLIIADGGNVIQKHTSSSLRIGDESGAVSNSLWITGQDSRLRVGTWLLAGNSSGTSNWIRVENGGRADCGNIYAGRDRYNFDNSVVVADNGSIYSSGSAFIAGGGDSVSNRVEISGAGSLWSQSGPVRLCSGIAAAVGNNVRNHIRIRDGAVASGITTLDIASGPNDASNSVIVAEGGLLYSTGQTIVGNHASAEHNRILVTGANSLWHAGGANLIVGLAGSADNELVIDQGGRVAGIGTLTVAAGNRAILAGGTLELTAASIADAPFAVGDGAQSATLTLLGGEAAFSEGLTVATRGWLEGTGTVESETAIYGTLDPGTLAGPGSIAHVGPLSFMAGSTSRIEILAYTSPGSGWDLVTVEDGALTLNGDLRVLLTDGFMPEAGQSFLVMTNETHDIAGSFANVVNNRVRVYADESDPHVGWITVQIEPRSVTLGAFSPPGPPPPTMFRIF